jgi:2,5-diketo-D-gluconate reductase B
MQMTTTGIPMLGLGTFGRTGDEGAEAILAGLEIGYRHIDTAQNYDTETSVAAAVAKSGLPRDEVFVTTKVGDHRLEHDDFLASLQESLERLESDYIDLLLVHWPSKNDAVPFEDYMTALAETKARGWARRIGVSNFTVDHLRRSDAVIGAGQLATNQVELHPYLQSPVLRDYAKKAGLPLTAYMPLAKGRVSEDAVLARVAERHGATAAAVSLAFLMQEGHVVIPASSNPDRLRANFSARDLTLEAEEMRQIRALDRGLRLIDPDKAPDWDDRPSGDLQLEEN